MADGRAGAAVCHAYDRVPQQRFGGIVEALRSGVSSWAEGEATSTVSPWLRSFAGQMAAMIAYRPWRPIWFTRRWRVLISTGGEPAIRAAMKSTTTIPIVFILGEDPVEWACRQFNPPAAT